MNGEEEKKQDGKKDPVGNLFGIELEQTTKCLESDVEPE